jgi:hypothetical protein
MVYVFVVVVDAAILAPAVVAALGDLAALGAVLALAGLPALAGLLALGDLLAVLTAGELVLAECALALTAREHENPVRPSVIRTAMIPAILRITR